MDKQSLQSEIDKLTFDLEILSFSHWEHFKRARELAQAIWGTNPRVQSITKVANELANQMQWIEKQINEKKLVLNEIPISSMGP